MPRGLADVALSVTGGTYVQCLIYLQFRKLVKLDSGLLREHLSLLALPNKAPRWGYGGFKSSFSSHWSGDQMSTIKVSAELVPPEASPLGL